MRWKKKKSAPEPQEALGNLSDMTLDEHMMAAQNVMTCREFLNLFMSIIHDHRQDGHECVAYCMPGQLYLALEDLELDEVKMVLTVALKDMYNVYLHAVEDPPA